MERSDERMNGSIHPQTLHVPIIRQHPSGQISPGYSREAWIVIWTRLLDLGEGMIRLSTPDSPSIPR